MKKNEIALTLYTVRDFCQTEKDLLNTLKKIKKIGYDAIQVSSIGPINPIEIKKMCDDIGLTICATHEPNEEIINNTEVVIEKLNTLNCSYTALPILKI
jgi:sugar phosphate isomerase/epimerase